MSRIKISSTLGIAADEILARKHNLWVGVSDSKWFHAEGNLEELILFSLEYTKDELLVWIPGRLYATNYLHLDRLSRAQAIRGGYAVEERFFSRITRLLSKRTREERSRVRMAGYDDCLTPAFVRRRSLLYREFSEEGEFYKRVVEIADGFLVARQRTVSKYRAEASALYLLQELPSFLAPLGTIDSSAMYQATVYPGFGKIDELASDLKEGECFPELTERLRIENPSGIVNVELEDP